MKAADFCLPKEIKFDFESGITSFRDTRLVLFDANAIGLLKEDILKTLGYERTRELYLSFGYRHGFADFLQMKVNYKFDTEMDLLASGPTIHTWEGIVKATPKEIRFDRKSGEFFFTGVWKHSYEAEQWLSFRKKSHEPVCWTLTGYASGWSTAFFGKPLLAVEPVCAGKGDRNCEWLIQPPEAFGSEAEPYIQALRKHWKEAK
jgi:hypothetical protein